MPTLHTPVVHLPARRLTGGAVAATFGGRPPKGARAAAAFDEDAVTLAVAAGQAAMEAAGAAPDAVFLATSSPPVGDKTVAALVAAGLGCGRGVRADDAGGGPRGGLVALAAACDAVAAGGCTRALAIASELRTEPPGSPGELRVGDGAVAVWVTAAGGPLVVRARHAVADPFAGQWRAEGERFQRSADVRFATAGGEFRLVPEALQAACAAADLAPAALAAATVASSDARAVAGLCKRAGVAPDAVRPDAVAPATGNLGAAHGLALLAGLVAGASAGQRVALAVGGDGADAWVFEAVADVPAAPPLPDGEPIAHYGTWLRSRGLIPASPAPPMEPFTSASLLLREQDRWWHWEGRRCTACGVVQVLPLPHCHACRSESLTPVALQKTGIVFTVTAEHYTPSPEPPTGMVVVDLDPLDAAPGAGGGRATVQWAGAAGPIPAVGDRVRLVLRRYHTAEGWPHYWWKAVPAR